MGNIFLFLISVAKYVLTCVIDYKMYKSRMVWMTTQLIVPFQLYIADIPADAILELFGKTFFEFCQDSGYDKILQVLGATPRDFLQVIIVYIYLFL